MNKKELQSKTAYDRIAEDYDNTFDGRFTHSFKDELVAAVKLGENAAVLDVACGNGELLSRLNRKGGIRGTGIDISDEMIRVAKMRHPEFEFQASPCTPLPFADTVFDVVTVSAAFHHFPDPDGFATEAFRVLKEGGRLYIAEVFFTAPFRQLMNLLILPVYNSGDVKIYTPKELLAIVGEAGFSDIAVQRKGKIQLLSARK